MCVALCAIPNSMTLCRAPSFRELRRHCMAKSTLLANTTEEGKTPIPIPITQGGEIIPILDGVMRGH